MKWKNKGNEFLRYEFLERIKKVYIYGAGSRGKIVCNQIEAYCKKGLEITFIDERYSSFSRGGGIK